MTLRQTERLQDLTTVLEYDSYGEKRLTDFDRMLIHKERSAVINGACYYQTKPVEEKIKSVLHVIAQMNWKKPED